MEKKYYSKKNNNNDEKKKNKYALSKEQYKAINQLILKNEMKDVEKKYWVSAIATAPLHTNPSFGNNLLNLTQIPQGTTDQARVGDSLTLLKYYIRGSAYYNPAGGYNSVIRFILVTYSPNTPISGSGSTAITAPIFEQIMQSLGSNSPRNVFAGYYNDDKQLLKFHEDITLSLDSYHPTAHFEMIGSIPEKWANMQFVTGSTNATYSVFLLGLADTPSNSANLNTFSAVAKFTFLDC